MTLSDGAHAGLLAHDAMTTVLGDTEPKPSVERAELLQRVMAATPDAHDYSEASCYLAQCILNHWELHSDDTALSAWDLCKRVEATQPMLDDFTGFMWGWSVNAARWLHDLPPVRNPALVEIAVEVASAEDGAGETATADNV